MSEGFEEVLYFYDGLIEARYNHALHAYTRMDGDTRILVPGSTTVLDVIDKPALVQWSANSTVEWVMQNLPIEDSRKNELQAIYAQVKAKAILVENGSMVTLGFNEFATLLNQARFNYRKISETAKDIGHLAHEWLEVYIKEILAGTRTLDNDCVPPEDPQAALCVSAAINWMRRHQFRPIASEKKIYSLEFDYFGTYDWLGYVTGCGDSKCCPFSGIALAQGDFKSSKGIWNEYLAQLASYWHATEEEFPSQPIDIGVILRLGKNDGEFESRVVTRPEAEAAFEAFLGALMIYGWQKQISLDAKDAKAEIKAAAKVEKERLKALEPKKPRAVRKVKSKAPDMIPVEERVA